MPIPQSFNEIEHFQSVVRRYVNRLVKEDFKDLNDAQGNWTPDISSMRASMRKALMHEDNDSLILTIARLLVYYFVYGKAARLQADIYGIPKSEFDTILKYKPQVFLHFGTKKVLATDAPKRAKSEISFRLMTETSASLSVAKVNAIALKIKNLFAIPNKFSWDKGKIKYSYYDDAKGYRLQILALNKAEAKRIIIEILKIQDHIPDWEHLTFAENEEPDEAFPANPGTEIILGKTTKKPQKRPLVKVYFRYATLQIHNARKGINLVDTTGLRQDAIEKTY